jgi:hypothetical protein
MADDRKAIAAVMNVQPATGFGRWLSGEGEHDTIREASAPVSKAPTPAPMKMAVSHQVNGIHTPSGSKRIP